MLLMTVRGRRFAVLCLLAALSAACAPNIRAPSAGGPSQADLVAQVPDHAAADCTGTLDFVGERRFSGRSTCGAGFQGSADKNLGIGTHCVFSSSEERRQAGLVFSAGHFACSDGSRGTVKFEAVLYGSSGNAVAETTDGRMVTLYYN